MDFSDFDFNILHFDHLPSSNIHAQNLLKLKEIGNGTVIWTNHQSMGKGQRGKTWLDQPGTNLLMSLVLKLDLKLDHLFLLNKAIALAVYRLLDKLSVPELTIKWPNDLLIKDQKVAGLLLENQIQNNQIVHSVIGVGLNVNQVDFPDFGRQATSLKNVMHKDFEIEILLLQLLDEIKLCLSALSEKKKDLEREYDQNLYGYGKERSFLIDDSEFQAEIIGVDGCGNLRLRVNGREQKFSHGGVSIKV